MTFFNTGDANGSEFISERNERRNWITSCVGRSVGLVGGYTTEDLNLFLSLAGAGATVVLLDPKAPAPERDRQLSLAGASRVVHLDEDFGFSVVEEEKFNRQEFSHGTAHVAISSSGSTGSPKLVWRTSASLMAEGRRLAQWSNLHSDDLVLLPIPYWHAYALGWVYAAMHVGCSVVPVDPQSIGRLETELIERATVVPLVPTVARLLSIRRKPIRNPTKLRMVMVGAGAVDAELEGRFMSRFGIGLSRNYGSTETGALFSGEPGLPESCVGRPMADVEARIDGAPLSQGRTGELEVSTGDGDWHSMGDLVEWDEEFGLTILGRKNRSIRRGDRWVSPEEVEIALANDPSVLDARVMGATPQGGVNKGNQRLLAHIVTLGGTGSDLRPILDRLKLQLAPHKIPDKLVAVPILDRTSSGKVPTEKQYIVGSSEKLVEAAQAYRASETLFALSEAGILARLTNDAMTVSELCDAFDLDISVGHAIIELAASYGIVQQAQGNSCPDAEDLKTDMGAFGLFDLERFLSRRWNSREAVGAALSSDFRSRPFNLDGPTTEFRTMYRSVIHGPNAKRRAKLGARLTGIRPGERVLEITAAGGHYSNEITELDVADLGPFALRESRSLSSRYSAETFDIVIISNAIHLREESSDLRFLASILRPGGRLLIDDVFLDEDRRFLLDWITHGGDSWPTVESLGAALPAVGLTIRRNLNLGNFPQATLILATKDVSP